MRRCVLGVAVALVVVGCAGDDESLPEAPTITTPPATDPDDTSPPPATDPPAATDDGPTDETTTTGPPGVPLDELALGLEDVAEGFDQPVFVTAPPGDRRLFVVDQPGRIWVVDDADQEVFLDITDRVVFGGERGLLGLAFPPDHADTGVFYVDYVTGADGGEATRVSAFTVGADGVADPGSEQVLLSIPQPASNHNGGMITFGPDGNLWVAMGDGGNRDDSFGQAQDPTTLLGALLRISPTGGAEYAIPADNPFVDGSEGAAEVWAFGLRNPWRFSFDGDDLWIGDVGQDSVEEIDLLDVATDAGANLGWPRFEGSTCYLSSDCADDDVVAPVLEYHQPEGCSITGGYVYRGADLPELDGHFLYGDFCGGWVRGLTVTDGEVDDREWFPAGSVPGLTSFGIDDAGELYVTSSEGEVYRLVRE